MTVRIVDLAFEHEADWRRLYEGYALFYARPQTDAMRSRVWGWLMDPDHPVKGIAALDHAGRVVGILHFRPFPRPLAAETAGFLDDLFVDPACRRSGVARALFEAARGIARDRGWPLLRWITQESNAPGRTLYDQIASATTWVTYDMSITDD